jgi:hypothetical protein
MARTPRPWPALLLAVVPACAGGVESPDATFGPPPGGPAPASDDDASDDDDDPFPDPDPIDTTTGWPPADGTTSRGDEATTAPPPDDTTSGSPPDTTGGDDGPVGNCPNLDTCVSASGIGLVSGDTGAQSIGASGSEPTWIEFQVTENDDSLVGAQLSFTVTLTSPASADFDLYVYRSAAGGSSGCNGMLQQSMSTGSQDAVSMTWGEGLVPNGLDDGVWVSVEIRAKDDACMPPDEWTLEVEGNT